MPTILALIKLSQEDEEFRASLNYKQDPDGGK